MSRTFTKRAVRDFILPMLISCCGAAVGDPPVDDSASAGSGKIVNKASKIKTSLKCKESTGLNYRNFGRGFLANYCTTCHSSEVVNDGRMGAPDEINFDSAEGAQIWRARILKVVKATAVEVDTPAPDDEAAPVADGKATAVAMPPDGSLLAEDRSLLLNWLNCGAPTGDP